MPTLSGSQRNGEAGHGDTERRGKSLNAYSQDRSGTKTSSAPAVVRTSSVASVASVASVPPWPVSYLLSLCLRGFSLCASAAHDKQGSSEDAPQNPAVDEREGRLSDRIVAAAQQSPLTGGGRCGPWSRTPTGAPTRGRALEARNDHAIYSTGFDGSPLHDSKVHRAKAGPPCRGSCARLLVL